MFTILTYSYLKIYVCLFVYRTGRTILKADTHIACRSHAVPLRVYNVSFRFDLHNAAVSDSHLPCQAHAMLRPCRSSQGHSTAVSRLPSYAVALRRTAWSGHGMESVNQTRPHCINQMGKTNSKPLAARHGRGKAWARHGHGMLCVNRP